MNASANEPQTAMMRSTDDVLAMALAVQANLVQLQVAVSRRFCDDASSSSLAIRAPGAVQHYRETLIDRTFLSTAPDAHLHLRMREVWGQFCMMHWLCSLSDPPDQCDFSQCGAGAALRCPSVVDVKHTEVHAMLWCFRFEQRRRSDPEYSQSTDFEEHKKLAERIPAQTFGKSLHECSDEELLLGACEHAGMLAALRWAQDRERTWGQPGIMDVADTPF